MVNRIFSTLLLWAVTIAAVYFGRTWGWTLVIWALSAAATAEACAILRRMRLTPNAAFAQTANAAIFAGACILPAVFGNVYAFSAGAIVLAALFVAAAPSLVFKPYGSYATRTFFPTILVVVCVPFMLQWFVAVATIGGWTGIIFGVWILAAAKFSDVGAYVTGSAFGRHKLAEHISPNKTWEGVVGGLLASAAVGAGIAHFAHSIVPTSFNPVTASIAGVFIGAVAIVSDLLESALKRRADIKDSGAMIPGIGGALDLADSLVLSAPAGVILLLFII